MIVSKNLARLVGGLAGALCTSLLASQAVLAQAIGVSWADDRAHDKGCRNGAHIFHVRCERADQDWSDRCDNMLTRPFRGSQMTTQPVRLPDRAWTEVAIADGVCGPKPAAAPSAKPDWADARAHDKGCYGYKHVFHVRCEKPDGSSSTECTDMPTRKFLGREMVDAPKRLPDRAWTEVVPSDSVCGTVSSGKNQCRDECDTILGPAVQSNLSDGSIYGANSSSEPGLVIVACHGSCELTRWADLNTAGWFDKWAAAKGCNGENREYHVPCTDRDGIWVLNRDEYRCGDLPGPMFGKKLAKPATDLGGMFAWRSFELADDTCKVNWADARAHDKGCRGSSHIFHVRCERPDGSASTDCSPLLNRQFRGRAMTTAPIRLPDRAWSEVAIDDPTCNSKLSAPTPPKPQPPQPPHDPAPRPTPQPPAPQPQPKGPTTTTNPPTGTVVLQPTKPGAPGNDPTVPFTPTTPLVPTETPVCDDQKVATCKSLIQGYVPWNMSPEPKYRVWNDGNLSNLCRCTQDAPKTVQCFQDMLYKHTNDWSKAIELCKAR
jgi:hypothetical protein